MKLLDEYQLKYVQREDVCLLVWLTYVCHISAVEGAVDTDGVAQHALHLAFQLSN